MLGRCTITDLELGFSASNEREWELRQAMVLRLQPLDITPAVVNRAKVVQRLLAERHLKGRKVPDLLIAAAAELAGLSVLHYDKGFELIASVTGPAAAVGRP